MKVLIELYDKDTLKNIVAPLTLRPDRWCISMIREWTIGMRFVLW